MFDTNTLRRQHEEIQNVIKELRGLITETTLEKNALNIANQVSLLAGKLKIHLSTEDRVMYPYLLNSSSTELRSTAQYYIKEMGGIREEFINYKSRFNTRTKIVNEPTAFLQETEKIFAILESRINKEDTALYPVI